MDIQKKAGLVFAIYGAIALSLLMVVTQVLGYGQYNWMLFVTLLLFFAMGADFKLLPSMILCYFIGMVWGQVNGLVMGVIGQFLPMSATGIVTPIILIFLILTIHDNFFSNTIIGNIPALFLGLAESFFMFSHHPHESPLVQAAIFLYSIILIIVLVKGGEIATGIVFSDEALAELAEDETHENA